MTHHMLYNPASVDPELLDQMTVGRKELLSLLISRVTHLAEEKARPHTLVVGPRGSGKSHLLSVVLHRAAMHPKMAASVAIARLPEDALSLGSYASLLVEIIIQVEPAELARCQQLRREGKTVALERLLMTVLGGRVLLLVLENLNRIFAAIGRNGQAAFRALVETSCSITVLASTPQLFKGISSRSEPWFGAFEVAHLGDLSLAEGTELLKRSARQKRDFELQMFLESPTGQARLMAVEHLAGGSPRMWHVLASCITLSSLEALIPVVETLLDELTPYYQQRLWELGQREQDIVAELGRTLGARTVTDLAQSLGTSAAGAATSLGRLEKASWVAKSKLAGTDQRTSWYELREPMLWYFLQTRTSHGAPVRMFTELLRAWFIQEERRDLLNGAAMGSDLERRLAESIDADRPSFSVDFFYRAPAELLARAKVWAAVPGGASDQRGSSALGAAIESLLTSSLLLEPQPMRDVGPLPSGLAQAMKACVETALSSPETNAALLKLASSEIKWEESDLAWLQVVLFVWSYGNEFEHNYLDLLLDLHGRGSDPLSLEIRQLYGRALARSTSLDPAQGAKYFRELAADQLKLFSPNHIAVLTSQQWEAYLLTSLGKYEAAHRIFQTIVPTLQEHHPNNFQLFVAALEWLQNSYRWGRKADQVKQEIPPTSLRKALTACFGMATELKQLQWLTDLLDEHENSATALLVAFTELNVEPENWRKQLLEQASGGLSEQLLEIPRLAARAIEGDVIALASLPDEVRRIAMKVRDAKAV